MRTSWGWGGVLLVGAWVGACTSTEAVDKRSGAVQPGPSGCKTDADCTSLVPGFTCVTATGQCVATRPSSTAEGTSCTRSGELACAVDATTKRLDGSVLACDGSKYTKVFACPSGQTCYSSGEAVRCGTDATSPNVAAEGGPCTKVDTVACSFDKQVLYECVAGAWKTVRHCAPSECGYADIPGIWKGLQCANGGYSIGDECRFDPGQVICSTDMTQILGCADGKTVVDKTCAAPQKCVFTSGGITCQ